MKLKFLAYNIIDLKEKKINLLSFFLFKISPLIDCSNNKAKILQLFTFDNFRIR